MKLFTLNFTNKEPLYIQIYKKIKQEIINKNYVPNEKIPSKRKLASHLNVSLNTICTAYNLLLDEGYIKSIEKKGYFITDFTFIKTEYSTIKQTTDENNQAYIYDFTTKNIDNASFPFFTWAKLSKQILYNNNEILNKSSNKGTLILRQTISQYLQEVKGIAVSTNNIIVGCGIEYLLSLLINLIQTDEYAIENPGYQKIALILNNNQKKVSYIPLDNEGININFLKQSKAQICYVTPANQFPTGKKMSLQRKIALINWTKENENNYIIEDDFDSEFRIYGNPPITLYSLEKEKIIFISTFSRTIAPSLRVSYMILPDILLRKYEKFFGNYSNTVSTFEQIIITEFINNGFYTRHINKIKNIYRKKRELIINKLKQYPNLFKINLEDSYLSVIVEIKKDINIPFLKQNLQKKSLDINFLSDFDYYKNLLPILIIGYSQISLNQIELGLDIIIKELKNN